MSGRVVGRITRKLGAQRRNLEHLRAVNGLRLALGLVHVKQVDAAQFVEWLKVVLERRRKTDVGSKP